MKYVRVRHGDVPLSEAQRFAQMYRNGLSMAEIAAITHRSRSLICRHLHNLNVPIRAQGRKLRNWDHVCETSAESTLDRMARWPSWD